MADSYADVVRALFTPQPASTPAVGLTRLDQPLDHGVPQRLRLDAEHELALLVPTGLAVDWRDADPAAPVSAAAQDRAPRGGETGVPVGDLRRPPARLALLEGGAVAAVAPLVAGGPRRLGRIDLQVLDWELHAARCAGRVTGSRGSRSPGRAPTAARRRSARRPCPRRSRGGSRRTR